ncbi:hypothetical protein L53_03685 [Hyphomonas sp. L-53-1-40]|uniref:hypothetical protein n=1 Tax=Hyphomonas sp. L-53-1-40 TaxID=1207058 RepID=UPI0004589BFE|nr:hypothetical protein [Hyphomonas sp. L-53-1-40]KCZ66433.1 hypothetical protein L53_03685 [Hyphomonas sp. L-53-1-40]
MDCSLFSPIRNLPWYLYPVWPLIFLRIQRVRAWFRRAGGPGSQMLWGVDARGRVTILALSDDLSGRQRAPLPGAEPSRALHAALSGETFHLRHMPCPRQGLESVVHALVPLWAVYGPVMDTRGAILPMPDT